MIKSLPIEENPREKAVNYGIEILNNVELLALILRTGNKNENVLELASRLLNEVGGMSKLSNVNYSFLVSLKGIKKAKAIQLLAVIELCKRITKEHKKEKKISEPLDIYLYLKNKLMLLKQEHFMVICLDSQNHIIKEKNVFIGSLNMSVVTPREVFKEAISMNSAKIVLAHNHPSGYATPSKEDIEITNLFYKLGDMMSIEVVDHVIIGWNQFYSMKSNRIYYDDQIN